MLKAAVLSTDDNALKNFGFAIEKNLYKYQ